MRRRNTRRRVYALDLVVSVVVLAIALWVFLPQITTRVGGDVEVDPSASEPLRQLSELSVMADGPDPDAPPYSRVQFGDGWADLDGDGCTTRNEILARDLTDVQFKQGTGDCVVIAGTLLDPYTGEDIQFVRGEGTSAEVQIDHVVPLADAWQRGAWQWTVEDRLRFSNDRMNLLAVAGQANQEKGAASADRWMPPDDLFRCDYAARQVAVKYRWDLAVTQAEVRTLNDVLSRCPDVVVTE